MGRPLRAPEHGAKAGLWLAQHGQMWTKLVGKGGCGSSLANSISVEWSIALEPLCRDLEKGNDAQTVHAVVTQLERTIVDKGGVYVYNILCFLRE